MAKRAKRKAAKKKSGKAKRPSSAKRVAKKTGRTKKATARKRASASKSRSASRKRAPAMPSGREGARRPSNRLQPPGRGEPREIAQAEPDARFDDPRRPDNSAREHPDGSMPPLERQARYMNTDEQS